MALPSHLLERRSPTRGRSTATTAFPTRRPGTPVSSRIYPAGWCCRPPISRPRERGWIRSSSPIAQRGASFNINYLFSKAIDDATTFGGGVAQNDRDIRAERSLSNFDHRHVLNGNYVLTSPFGHESHLLAQHRMANKFLEDWTLSGGITAQTGSPLNPRVAGNQSDSAGTGANGTTRPNATGLAIDAGGGYFNTVAFILPVPGQFGNAGRSEEH